MNKNEFIDRLILAGETARGFAASLEHIVEDLPEAMIFTLDQYNDKEGVRGPVGTIKFFGGRFIKPEELERLRASRAAALLWVDGFIPAWINITVSNRTDSETEFMLTYCKGFVPANENELKPDINVASGNSLAPFRIRGPSVAGWSERTRNA